MWSAIGRSILRNRIVLLVTLGLVIAFFGYMGSKLELSYSYSRALPTDDPAFIEYEKFKELYGEDGSVMVLGFQDPDFFKLKKFNEWYDLSEQIRKMDGIQEVMSVTRIYNIVRNDSLQKFDFLPIVPEKPATQAQLDSIKQVVYALPFYEGLIMNKDSGAMLMAVTFTKKDLNSEKRIHVVNQITELGDQYGAANNLEMHYSGMPYIRTVFMQKVSHEMVLFLILAVVVVAIILFAFFRSFYAVFFSIVVCLAGVTVSLGTIQLFEYKMTVLTSLIPPLIMVIGVPNCIFIIIKYQEELVRHGNKIKALARTVEKVALSNFLANVTTAIGFGVFYFTNSSMLVEFGVVAAINVMTTYVVAHILLPIIYSYLPAPAPRYTKHLKSKWINSSLKVLDNLVHKQRKWIYTILTVITIIACIGMTRINVVGKVVDDLPQRDPVYAHLHFFERNFHGVVPYEINVDTKKANGVFSNSARTLYKIKSLQRMMSEYDAFSRPLSVVEGLKFAYQGYKDGEEKYYILPGSTELKNLSDYIQTVKGRENKLAAFMDSTRRFTRVSYQMADVGSDSLKTLMVTIRPRVDSIFNYDREANAWAADSLKYDVALTGFSHVFLKSNEYLFHHLFVSLLIAIGLILLIGMVLFRSIAIIVLSKLPCLIPLALTAGIMGFMNIPFKPSTILIFSIAFGIASDGTIYILTEYRNQLRKGEGRSIAISRTIRELGASMIYTNVILFFGFAIFAASTFGGTKAMGILISITLLFSLITNLLLMPSILLSLEKRLATKAIMKEPLLQLYDEEEDIDLDELKIRKAGHQTEE